LFDVAELGKRREQLLLRGLEAEIADKNLAHGVLIRTFKCLAEVSNWANKPMLASEGRTARESNWNALEMATLSGTRRREVPGSCGSNSECILSIPEIWSPPRRIGRVLQTPQAVGLFKTEMAHPKGMQVKQPSEISVRRRAHVVGNFQASYSRSKQSWGFLFGRVESDAITTQRADAGFPPDAGPSRSRLKT
jgi:hypothetical protein